MAMRKAPKRTRREVERAKQTVSSAKLPTADMKKFNMMVDGEVLRALKVGAAMEGRTMTELVTSLVTPYLKERGYLKE